MKENNMNVSPVTENIPDKAFQKREVPQNKKSSGNRFVGIVKGTRNLNVRAEPKLAAPIVTVAREGDEITVLGAATKNGYYKIISADQKEGYVSSNFVKVMR